MKKILSTLLCLILTMSCISLASADKFEYAEGIKWGKSVSYVKSHEKCNYCDEREENSIRTLVYKNDRSSHPVTDLQYGFMNDKLYIIKEWYFHMEVDALRKDLNKRYGESKAGKISDFINIMVRYAANDDQKKIVEKNIRETIDALDLWEVDETKIFLITPINTNNLSVYFFPSEEDFQKFLK